MGKSSRSVEAHYDTMPTETIMDLPVGNLADKDCALFLWVTMPKLFEAQRVIAA